MTKNNNSLCYSTIGLKLLLLSQSSGVYTELHVCTFYMCVPAAAVGAE